MAQNLTDVYTHAELVALAERHGIARVNGKSADELARDLTDSGYVYSEKADARRNPSYPRRYQGIDLTAEPLRVGNAVFTPLTASGLPDPEREVTEADADDDAATEPPVEEKSVIPPDPNIQPQVITPDEQNDAIQTEPTKLPKVAKPATDAEAKK
jgi:hypothetical protein